MTEGHLKVVARLEIVAGVLLGFAEHPLAVLDEVEDDFAEVLAGLDAEFPEGEHRHGPEGFEGVEADAFEQLLAGDVAVGRFAGGVGGFVYGLLGVIEGFADEVVSFARVAAVELDDLVYDFLKMDRMHRTEFWAALTPDRVDGRTERT